MCIFIKINPIFYFPIFISLLPIFSISTLFLISNLVTRLGTIAPCHGDVSTLHKYVKGQLWQGVSGDEPHVVSLSNGMIVWLEARHVLSLRWNLISMCIDFPHLLHKLPTGDWIMAAWVYAFAWSTGEWEWWWRWHDGYLAYLSATHPLTRLVPIFYPFVFSGASPT